MARSLLLSRIVGLLLLAAASSMSACIIPVAPEFQDPPTNQLAAPYFLSASPMFGTLQTIVGTAQWSYTVVVTGSGPGKPLWYRSALDYPLTPAVDRIGVQPTMLTLDASGQKAIPLTLDCSINPDPSVGVLHEFTLLVADQQFVSGGGVPLEKIENPSIGHVISNSWWVNMSCPAQTSGGSM